MSTAQVVLFDLGGVLLPFDRERRVDTVVRRTGARAHAVRGLFAGELPQRLDLGQADEADFAEALSGIAGRAVSADEAIELILSVFTPPNLELWALAARLSERMTVGGFTDNPSFVRRVFPPGASLDPLFVSCEIGAAKPAAAAFAVVEAALDVPPTTIVFIDDSPANVAAAASRGWDAILFVTNAALGRALAPEGTAMTVRIRSAMYQEAQLIHALIWELAEYERLAHEVKISVGDVARILFSPTPKAYCEIAEVDGEPVGFALWFYSVSTFEGRHGLYLEDLYVRPAARGIGAGKALMAALARRCVEEGLARFEWAVLDWNTPSIEFYDRLGAAAKTDWITRRLSGEALLRLAQA